MHLSLFRFRTRNVETRNFFIVVFCFLSKLVYWSCITEYYYYTIPSKYGCKKNCKHVHSAYLRSFSFIYVGKYIRKYYNKIFIRFSKKTMKYFILYAQWKAHIIHCCTAPDPRPWISGLYRARACTSIFSILILRAVPLWFYHDLCIFCRTFFKLIFSKRTTSFFF